MFCSNCEFFRQDNGALFVGDCLAEDTSYPITTLNHRADFCSKFKNKETNENGKSGNNNTEKKD